MKKILLVVLGLYVGSAFADSSSPDVKVEKPPSPVVGSPQPYREYIKSYMNGLITAACKEGLKGDNKDAVWASSETMIKIATQGMKKDTESYYTVHDTVVTGTAIGLALKEKGKLEKIGVDSCEGAVVYLNRENEFIKMIDALLSPAPQTAKKSEKNVVTDDKTYRTTATALAALYNENEVAADDKIGDRKVEITGVVQDIGKDFTDDVVIRLQSGNKFMPVHLRMENTERSTASKLKKGQKSTITCEKMMLVVGAPSGSSCKFN